MTLIRDPIQHGRGARFIRIYREKRRLRFGQFRLRYSRRDCAGIAWRQSRMGTQE